MNTHPYAVKTTSTGLLSRSNSSASSPSPAHRFLPSSPTKSTKDSPRPLPVPPSLQRARAHTLSSLHLPDDPRTWSTADLATYLSSSAPLHDFVTTHHITGKQFLRFTDGDLDEYGVSPQWQKALLRASRALRHDSIRGRVWHTSDSSSSSLESIHRGRSDSESGRVKGMVASFERSQSPTKSTSSSSSSHRSLSPVHSRRPRPHSDIIHSHTEPRMLPFPPPTHGPPPLLPSQDTGALPFPPPAGTPPRLSSQRTSSDLPFPPPAGPPPRLPSQHTSSALPPPTYGPPPPGALPFSPQSTGPQTSPSPTFSDDPNYTRPLPFPPHSGQYYQPLTYTSGDIVDGMPLPRGPSEPDVMMLGSHVHPLPLLPHLSMPEERSNVIHHEIFSPQPRHGRGRDSPTKVLEEKLEEVLEPRPRSRVVSMNRKKSGGSRVGTPPLVKDGGVSPLVTTTNGVDEEEQVPRARVVSLSGRSLGHRLSGVEVWGESHPPHSHHHRLHVKKRLGIPFGDAEEEHHHDPVVVEDEEEQVETPTSTTSSEDGEIGGIESVLEKSVVEEGVRKEPKSSVIRVSANSSLIKEEEEESMEKLLEREGVSGAEAWERGEGVDTVKRVVVGSGGRGRGVGDVFSDVVEKENGRVKEGNGDVFGADETMKKKNGDVVRDTVLAETMKNEEIELGKRVMETRMMVEDIRRRLVNIETWIDKHDTKVQITKQIQTTHQVQEPQVKNHSLPTRLFQTISTWLSLPPPPPSPTKNKNKKKRYGLEISSWVVLVGVGMCMVLVRVLGRRRGVGGGGGGGFGVGRLVGHWVLGGGRG